jgi:hypothetical protein
LKPNVYDVFMGKGWDQWARVVRHKGGLEQVGGNAQLNPGAFRQLKARLFK